MRNKREHVYDIKNMTIQDAQEIVRWQYEPPYDLYNLTADEETIQELMDGTYFSVYNKHGKLTGYFCYGKNAQVPGGRIAGLYEHDTAVDIGLGLHPDLTGQGYGLSFLQAGMSYGRETNGIKEFRLSVAAFNKRAIRLYERAGFHEAADFENGHGDSAIAFKVMMLPRVRSN